LESSHERRTGKATNRGTAGLLLASGELVSLLDEFGPEPMPVHIVHRQGQYENIRVRAFIEMLAENLKGDRGIN